MSKLRVNLVVFLGLLGCVTADIDIASVFTICKNNDPNLNECLKGAIQDALRKMADGVKELNMPVLDPLPIEEATIPPGSGAVHVEQKFKNIKVYNIARTTEIKNVRAKITSNSFEIDLDTFSPEYKLEADYKFNGRVLVLPIVGDGTCVVKLDDIESQVHIVGETFEKNGKIYGNVKSMDLKFLPKNAKFQFNNLFNGDPNLGEQMNKLLNENWKEVFHDVKDSYEKFISNVLIKYSNDIFHNVEFDSLFAS